MKLTATQKMVLLYLLRYEDWTSDAPVNQRCLNVLHGKGLVQVAQDKDGYWEKLTSKGREVANEIKERINK